MERKSREQRELKGFREMVVEEYLNGDKSARELGEYYGVTLLGARISSCRKAGECVLAPLKKIIGVS